MIFFLYLSMLPVLLGIPKISYSLMSVLNEKSGDNSVGFIPIANSINTLVGLGLSWLIETIYWHTKGLPVVVRSDIYKNQLISVIVCYVICLVLLLLRRKLSFFGYGELGGYVVGKFVSAYFLTFFWLLFFFYNFLQDFKLIKL
jgi:hypothetical protein